MGKLTPTNEEHLVEVFKLVRFDEELVLHPSNRKLPMIDVFILPLSWSLYELQEQYGEYPWDNEEFRDKYLQASMMGIALHKDVWSISGDASEYR